jgi:two-component system LytT family response regulator
MTAILIDDESSSRNALRQKLQANCPDISILAECENGEEGIKSIEEHEPDIVFLDVEMPRMNGFVMLQNLTHRNFELIFTTAYDHYAIQAIRFSALDYLVKPIEVKDLLDAVERVRQRKQHGGPNQRIETLLHNLLDDRSQHHRLAIPSQEGLQFVDMSDIIYL